MAESFEERFPDEQQEQPKINYHLVQGKQNAQIQAQSQQKQRFLDPPREIPKRAYSLQPDMANGWKPKRGCRSNPSNVFSINYEQGVLDDIVRQLYKCKGRGHESLVYLGPRLTNSYVLHQGRSYNNPYPIDKKQQLLFSGRNGMPPSPKLEQCHLSFDSDFEGGNLDAAIQRSAKEFDLFMRVDSNTRGHTNWYHFSVSNGEFIGTVRFTICNFRRDKSLYQRGLRPYVYSKLQEGEWRQGGKNVKYQRQRPRYDFLEEDQDYEWQNMQQILLTK